MLTQKTIEIIRQSEGVTFAWHPEHDKGREDSLAFMQDLPDDPVLDARLWTLHVAGTAEINPSGRGARFDHYRNCVFSIEVQKEHEAWWCLVQRLVPGDLIELLWRVNVPLEEEASQKTTRDELHAWIVRAGVAENWREIASRFAGWFDPTRIAHPYAIPLRSTEPFDHRRAAWGLRT